MREYYIPHTGGQTIWLHRSSRLTPVEPPEPEPDPEPIDDTTDDEGGDGEPDSLRDS